MPNDEKDREFRLRPPRPKRDGDEARKWSTAFRQIMRIARMSRAQGWKGVAKKTKAADRSRSFSQRCAVRVTYTPNRTSGQWAAHGRYLMRESAVHADSDRASAFGSTATEPDVTAILGEWQRAGDPRLFKMIIS